MEDKATPRPWRIVHNMPERIVGENVTRGHIAHVYAKGEPYIDPAINEVAYPKGEQKANAALIVRAVNSYDAHRALVEAARKAMVVLEASEEGCDDCGTNTGCFQHDPLEALRVALIAVDAAENA